MVSRSRKAQPFLVRHRGDLGRLFAVAMLATLVFTPSLTASYNAADWTITALGGALALCGAGLRLWCTRYIGGRRTDLGA